MADFEDYYDAHTTEDYIKAEQRINGNCHDEDDDAPKLEQWEIEELQQSEENREKAEHNSQKAARAIARAVLDDDMITSEQTKALCDLLYAIDGASHSGISTEKLSNLVTPILKCDFPYHAAEKIRALIEYKVAYEKDIEQHLEKPNLSDDEIPF